jgi:hypothetical protein
MARRLAFAIGAGLALGGCCHDIGSYVPPSSTRAEVGPLLKLHRAHRAKPRHTKYVGLTSNAVSPSENGLSQLDPNSKEWNAALDAISRAADEELKKRLIICKGCEQPVPGEQTGSIWPTRADAGYLSIQKTLNSLFAPTASPSAGPH